MLLHLLDGADTVNARFLYLRAPEHVKKVSKQFALVWQVVTSLESHNYEKAFEQLEKPFTSSAASTPGKEENHQEYLREVLVWYLQSYHVPKFVAKTYTSINMAELKMTLGLAKKSDAEAK